MKRNKSVESSNRKKSHFSIAPLFSAGARQLSLMLLVVLLAATNNVVGEEMSKEHAQKAHHLWSAFECVSLAAKAEMPDEQERLFLCGYEQGKQFIVAIHENKVQQQDLSSESPVGVLLLLEGPTPDFMLGRIFQAAQEEALKEILVSGGKLHAPEEQKLKAADRYRSKNCRLVGAVS